MLYPPQDPKPYARHPRSRVAVAGLPDGPYVYVQGSDGVVRVLEDGPHRHPRVLGGGRPARYAGDLTVRGGPIADVTNLSGTFRCDDRDGLIAVADALEAAGLPVAAGAVRFFPQDGGRPEVLR